MKKWLYMIGCLCFALGAIIMFEIMNLQKPKIIIETKYLPGLPQYIYVDKINEVIKNVPRIEYIIVYVDRYVDNITDNNSNSSINNYYGGTTYIDRPVYVSKPEPYPVYIPVIVPDRDNPGQTRVEERGVGIGKGSNERK